MSVHKPPNTSPAPRIPQTMGVRWGIVSLIGQRTNFHISAAWYPNQIPAHSTCHHLHTPLFFSISSHHLPTLYFTHSVHLLEPRSPHALSTFPFPGPHSTFPPLSTYSFGTHAFATYPPFCSVTTITKTVTTVLLNGMLRSARSWPCMPFLKSRSRVGMNKSLVMVQSYMV
jgi:hypothetical protein